MRNFRDKPNEYKNHQVAELNIYYATLPGAPQLTKQDIKRSKEQRQLSHSNIFSFSR